MVESHLPEVFEFDAYGTVSVPAAAALAGTEDTGFGTAPESVRVKAAATRVAVRILALWFEICICKEGSIRLPALF